MKWLLNKDKFFLTRLEKIVNKDKKYWSGKQLLEHGTLYAMVFSERATGKTTYFQCLAIYNYAKYNKRTCYIVRNESELKNFLMRDSFKTSAEYVSKLTENKWDEIRYKERAYWLCKKDNKGKIVYDSQPFMICVALSAVTTTKSKLNDNSIDIVWFEEFMTRNEYLPSEFIDFQNMISTIVRLRDDTIIIMTANTVNRYCPYFEEMGLYRVKQQPIGTTDVYQYNDDGLDIAVEYSKGNTNNPKQKKSNIYFGFNNPRLKMVTSGSWEIASYPHISWHSKFDEIIFDNIFIVLEKEIIRGEIRIKNDNFIYCFFRKTDVDNFCFKLDDHVYIHTTPILPNECLFFTDKLGKKIMDLLSRGHVFYQNNSVGEHLNNYLKLMKKYKIIRD